MTHITLSKKTSSKPCLEFYSDGSGEARRVTIEQFPFRIGRSETANLRVESAEVSREHVEIFERNGMCLVRDLGSTNGTQVNGKAIKETLLADGDVLRVAETELTFIASATSQFQRMVTQPIHARKSSVVACALPPEIAAARMMAEATLWQAIPTQLLAAQSMKHRTTNAFFAPLAASGKQSAPALPGAVVDRYRELERLMAVEAASELSVSNKLFLTVASAEIESPQRLFSGLDTLRECLPGGWELGVTISLPTDVDILRITEVYHQVREHELLVAFDEFQGNGGQVMHLQSLLPDYLVLASNMTKDLATSRQPLRRLESLLAACEELSIKPVLPRNESAHGLAMCQEIGFDLALVSAASTAAPAPARLSVTT